MNSVNNQLRKYIENNIFPIYSKNDFGHGIEHIKYVINRSLEFAKQFDNINLNMVYVIASFHDIAHYIDKDNHEILSAKIFYENKKMKDFFTDEQRKIIKEAIEDHRASLEYEPRSDYGKIVSSADRNTDIISVLKRTHAYTTKHYPNLDLDEMINRAYEHISMKFGINGYAKTYCYDKEFEDLKKDVEDLIKNKYEFAVKYMKVNGIMDVKEKALVFAMQAYMNPQSELDNFLIIHSIGIGKLLESFGCDDNVVAAGYLHNILEDPKYTIEDIEKEFGSDIASLVMSASEPNKSQSWEERKRNTIEETKNLPLRNKLVICANEINNLDDMFLKLGQNGEKYFSKFRRVEENNRWYYTKIYESLIFGENKNLPIFLKLKDILDKVFYKQDKFLKDKIFIDRQDYYKKLKELHLEKMELKRLKELVTLSKPFVIEFTGTPRTGKTTTINNLYDFFTKGGFDVSLIEEFTTSKYYKEELRSRFDKMSYKDRDLAIFEEVYKQLQNAVLTKKDLILIDRSLNDRQIWNYRRFVRGDIPKSLYLEVKEKYSQLSKELIDFLVVTYADSLVSLRRDYNSSLALEKRRFLNEENLDEYNKSLQALKEFIAENVDKMIYLDTSKMDINDVSVEVASQILPVMRKKYVKAIQKKYNLK